MNLYLNTGKTYSITDDQGREYSISEARQLFEEGKVTDFNLSFKRLTIMDWNIKKLKRYYEIQAGLNKLMQFD